MASLRFEGHSGYGDTGIEEFSFIYNKDRFKILPKYGVPGSLDKLQKFMAFVQYIAPKMPDKNPWRYRVNAEQKFTRVFDIYKNGEKLKDDPESPVMVPSGPEVEQMALPLTASLDKISSHLESVGHIKEAYELDIISNTIDKWFGNKSNIFFDEITNQGIEPSTAARVLDIADKQNMRSASEKPKA